MGKWLAACVSALVSAYGVFIIATEHYYGRTTKLQEAQASADGLQAVITGVGIIVIGLAPMSLWAKSGKAAGLWAAACLVVGLTLLVGSGLFVHH